MLGGIIGGSMAIIGFPFFAWLFLMRKRYVMAPLSVMGIMAVMGPGLVVNQIIKGQADPATVIGLAIGFAVISLPLFFGVIVFLLVLGWVTGLSQEDLWKVLLRQKSLLDL